MQVCSFGFLYVFGYINIARPEEKISEQMRYIADTDVL